MTLSSRCNQLPKGLRSTQTLMQEKQLARRKKIVFFLVRRQQLLICLLQ